MKSLNRQDFPGPQYPMRAIQSGGGNFLRAFIDWQLDLLSGQTDLAAGVTIIRPISTAFPPSLNTQDGFYTMTIRGLSERGEAVSESRIICSVNNELNPWQDFASYLALARNPAIAFVFSNTTEAGISYHAGDRLDDKPSVSFPTKLTQLLLKRFRHFNGVADKGWIITPCELIDYNSEALKVLMLRYAKEWQLSAAFRNWVETANTFCSTLVNRIVTGYPYDEAEKLEAELGYHDAFLDIAEYFWLFVIQGLQALTETLRLDRYPFNIRIIEDTRPYKARKVAVLNGAHAAPVLVAWLCGADIIGEAMQDEAICHYVQQTIDEEIIPALDLPAEELRQSADAVAGRFLSPYICHQLLAIALNGMTKFRTRILPQLLTTIRQHGAIPPRLTFTLAALIALHRGQRDGQMYPLQDDDVWLTRFSQGRKQVTSGSSLYGLVLKVLQDNARWGGDLTAIPGLSDQVTCYLEMILHSGMREALARL